MSSNSTRAPEPGDDIFDVLGLSPREDNKSTESEAVEVGLRVSQARTRAGLTGAAFGERVGLNRSQVSKVESGKRRVSVRELPAFARALGVSIQFLLGAEVGGTLALAHRLGQAPNAADGSTGELPATQRRALELVSVEQALAGQVDVPEPALSPAGARVRKFVVEELSSRPRNKAEAQRQGRRLAEEVRDALDLGGAEIGDLAALIEMHFAADVAVSPLGTQADGLCAHGEGRAIIVASSDFSEGHLRFTLAHELGHHLFDDPREVINETDREMFDDTMAERRVNAFAAHLLLPVSGVVDTLNWLGVKPADVEAASVRGQRALGTLVHRFGASLPAVLFQVAELGWISMDRAKVLADSLATTPTGGAVRGRAGDTSALATPLVDEVTSRVRPPRRLLEVALEAAQAEITGLGSVAVLLEREDDDALFDEVMGTMELAKAGA